jgi:uncharacterized repeat protein (TIGR03803 family)
MTISRNYAVTVRPRLARLGISALLLLLATQIAGAQTYKVLFQFRPGIDGTLSYGNLILDSAGNLYGTTSSDGTFVYGIVFKLSVQGKETVLHDFSGSGGDGESPFAGLTRDSRGNLYGTTGDGGNYGGPCGSAGCGTVFEVDAAGHEKVLYAFTGNPDGANPQAGVVLDSQGNIYGTTFSGGVNGAGTVFKVDSTGKETVLHSFNSGVDGFGPWGGVLRDKSGNLYGTTFFGGPSGAGALYKITPKGVGSVVYGFSLFGADGQSPTGNLIRDAAGNFYGTTENGGKFGFGTLFKVDKNGKETILHNFAGGKNDGATPFLNGLVQDSKGNLYGMTNAGGLHSFGVIYKFDVQGHETILRNFSGTDGKMPYGSLTFDSAGNLYGAALQGGTFGGGVVFRLTP